MKRQLVAKLLSAGIGAVLLGGSAILLLYAGASVAPLPVAASVSLFLTAAVVSGRIAITGVTRSKWFDTLSPVLFLIPLVMLLHVGYEYYAPTLRDLVELAGSLTIGIGIYLIVYTAVGRGWEPSEV